ncbi:MAG: hypothetical protein ACYDBQ_08430 [Thermoplasmatota archaeon]
MGVNLRDLFPARPVPAGWFAGKRIAVDGHNVAFRYLTSLRAPSGGLLEGPQGRPIAHLLGYLGLVRHLRGQGAEPIVVWDGSVHPRKRATVDERIQKRLEAALDAEEALASGDMGAHQRFLRATTTLDREMIQDCTLLLEALGVAVAHADHDAERYAASLCHAGLADAVATEDYDALVAGAPVVVRRAGARQEFLQFLADFTGTGGDAALLRHIAILCGTDWHPGVKGFGAKTAHKALVAAGGGRELVGKALSGAPGRHAELVRQSGLGLQEFDELDAFIAHLPPPAPPAAKRPDPGRAVALAEGLGIQRERVLACFC